MSDVIKGSGYQGVSSPLTFTSPFNAMDEHIRQVIAGKAFSGLVQVVAVHGGGTGGAPTVDVRPMVNQVDGLGNQTPHGIVHGLPCFRLQGGNGAVVLDPAVGDIGQAIICDRDISAVKASGAINGPGSARMNSWSDGCYYGSFLGGAVTNYVQFTFGGVNINTGGTVTITSPSVINLDAPVLKNNGTVIVVP